MTGLELRHAQDVLGNLRARVDDQVATVVHQDVQGEGVQNSVLTAPSPSLVAARCWPEEGWPFDADEEYSLCAS